MRHAKRTDENHKQVVEGIRAAFPEATVFDSSGAGRGFPDLVVGVWGINFLFEIKDPSKVPSARKLTPAQLEFHDNWQGQAARVHSAAEAIKEIAKHFKDQCTR